MKRLSIIIVVVACIFGLTTTQAAPPNLAKYQWQGTVDEIKQQENQIIIYDRPFDLNASVLVYAKDGASLLPITELRKGMQVGCVVDSQFNLKQVWILR